LQFSYYPGCTLKTRAREFEKSAFLAARALEIELVEQGEWQCCGAVFPLARDEIATYLSAVRSLDAAAKKGEKLVTLCAACYHVIKRANYSIKHDQEIRQKVNNYLEIDYQGTAEVIHYLEMLKDELGFVELEKKVKNPLQGKKIAPYYGCLLLRPRKIMEFDDPENPSIMEDFLKSIGAEPVFYPYRTECCGVYLSVKEEEIVEGMVEKIVSSAARAGAEAIVDACPLCHYNLEEMQKRFPAGSPRLPVIYFTDLLQEALLPEKTGVQEKA